MKSFLIDFFGKIQAPKLDNGQVIRIKIVVFKMVIKESDSDFWRKYIFLNEWKITSMV